MSTAIVNSVAVALKAKSPIVAIPKPGLAPFLLERNRLARSLRKLSMVDAEFINGWLVIHAVGPRVKAKRMVRSFPRPNALKLIDRWVRAERNKRKSPKPTVAQQRAIMLADFEQAGELMQEVA